MKLPPLKTIRLAQLTTAIGITMISGTASAQDWTDFQVGNTTRRALVYVPEGVENAPLLMSFHGRGIGAGWNQGGMMKFEPIADREGFAVVYPDSVDGSWDLGGTTDTDFVNKIIEDMSAKYSIDTDRVYASGFSMGGMFSHVLACKMPNTIAAIVPGNGYPLGGLSGCDTSRSVPIFHVHGTADDFVKYSGIHSFLETWIDQYGCPQDPVRTEPYPADKPDSQSFKEYWGPCDNGNGQVSEVTLVSVTGMIHDWATAGKGNTNEDPAFTGKPFDIDGSEEAWAFLKNHSLNGPLDGSGNGTGGADGMGTGGATPGVGGSGSGGANSASGGATGSGASNASGGSSSGSDGDPAGTGASSSGGMGTGNSGDDPAWGTPGSSDSGGCSYATSAGSSGLGGLLWSMLALMGLAFGRRKYGSVGASKVDH